MKSTRFSGDICLIGGRPLVTPFHLLLNQDGQAIKVYGKRRTAKQVKGRSGEAWEALAVCRVLRGDSAS